ncbi:hypothetical protein Y657_000325 [Salmonella enterica subsp. enterica]|nr:hypothetical protein [Salmonella enterica subsp. enterica]
MSGDDLIMLGFVSALSSAVAVMILLMSALLANLLSISLAKEMNKSKLNFESIPQVDKTDDENGRVAISISGLSLTPKILKPFENSPNPISIECSFGKNLSYEVASKYLTYNYIVSKLMFKNKKVIALPLKEKNNEANTCVIKEITQ